MMRWCVALLPVFALLAATSLETEIAGWHRDREARLRGEDGWLTVAGLFWLHPGVNRFGSDPKSDIALPAGPAHAGSFNLQNGKVTATVDGKTRAILHDSDDFVRRTVASVRD